MWTIGWPYESGQYLLWTQLVLLWMLFNYATVSSGVGAEALGNLAADSSSMRSARIRDLRKATLAGFLMALLPGLTLSHSLARSLVFLVGVLTLFLCPQGRLRIAASAPRKPWLAEWEILLNLSFIVFTGLIVGSAGLTVSAPLVRVPWPEGRLAAVLLGASAVVFVVHGGTYIVRGVLDKSDALPLAPPSSPGTAEGRALDAAEYNRGRIIGNIERLLMLLVIALGSYEGLGFLVAAKGLIRGRELEHRDFAEYFILGSLTSVCVALVVGAGLRIAAEQLWNS